MRRVLGLGLLLAIACGSTTPTPAGTSLLEVKFTAEQGGPPEGVAAEPQRHTQKIQVNPEQAATIEVHLDVVTDPATGGRYLYAVEVLAADSGQGALSAVLPSGAMPTNLGTPESPLASLPLMVQWERDQGCRGNHLGQTSIQLQADGKITQNE